MNFIRDYFPSSDGKNRVAYYVWEPENPVAVIQLSHGMTEYAERYAKHAEYFASKGFVFCGNDHLGHGNTAASPEELGYIGSADRLVDDLAKMTDIIKAKYPGLPVFLLGHSMGSFAARVYISKYADKISGVVLSGTAGPGNPTGIGKFMSKLVAAGNGHKRSKFVASLSTGRYSKHFGKDASPAAWLTADEEEVARYLADPFCNYTFTVDGYYNMFDMLGRVSRKDWAPGLPKDLPVLLIAGREDPVGDFGRGVEKVYGRMIGAGMTDVTMRLWDGGRHEVLGEVEPVGSESRACVADWIGKRI